MDFGKFDLLESRLGSLLDRLKSLEKDNLSLNDGLQAAKNELSVAQQKIAELSKVRESVVSRIDALLERISQADLLG
ncbi:MAG: cell division protein ZapB [Deltaproteobacteria bacterium]|jgi:chromosome segregation ATPase|nr:cell division protein ZapB [Deltaproteobacteria bacterium]